MLGPRWRCAISTRLQRVEYIILFPIFNSKDKVVHPRIFVSFDPLETLVALVQSCHGQMLNTSHFSCRSGEVTEQHSVPFSSLCLNHQGHLYGVTVLCV